MNSSEQDSRRRTLALIALIALAVLYLTNPLTRVLMRGSEKSVPAIAVSGFITPPATLLMIGSVYAITRLLRHRADRRGLLFGALTLMGWTVGMRISVLSQIESLSRIRPAGLSADALQKLLEATPIVWVSIVPVGLMFPLGLISLGLTLALAGPIPRWIGALLAIAGLLFPLGRAVGLEWALASCDLLMGTVFALIAWQIRTRPDLWS